MNESDPQKSISHDSASGSCWAWLVGFGCLLLIIIALFPPGGRKEAVIDAPSNEENTAGAAAPLATRTGHSRRRISTTETRLTAAELVAAKLSQFARSRRETMHRMARHFKVEVPAEMEHFFDLAEAGRVDEMKALFDSLRERKKQDPPLPGLNVIWPAMHETLGIAEEAANWPPQKLLDYGNAVLDSLRPGMVYVGGTDPGRFIPTLLNETSDGEHHIVLTQNALADNTYLDYANFLYSDRLKPLSKEDSQRAFQEYVTDAQKRLTHDQQFPNEPTQVRPGEDIQVIDNRVSVSGQVAVMAINEKLLQTLMRNNPDASFAMEESFPFSSVFADASALGPIMELRIQDEPNKLTAERAAQSVDY